MVLILLAVGLAYANSFPGSFYFDDEGAILQNRSIRRLSDWRAVLSPPVEAGVGGRPFANLSYALNHAVHEYRPGGYHAVAVVLHAAAALLLFGLVRRTLRRPAAGPPFFASGAPRTERAATLTAAAAALLWALHPVHPNVVDYVAQRTEGLMAVLYLLTLYAFVRALPRADVPGSGVRTGWGVAAVAACALGMATKEGMVTAPAIALLYDRTFVSGRFATALRRHWPLYLGLAATWLFLAWLMLTSRLSARGVGLDIGPSAYSYALTECRAVVRYLQLSVWPHPLIFDYGPTYLKTFREALPSALVLCGALLATAVAVWRRPPAGFCGAWFFVILSPTSSVIPIVQQPCAENRMHLPLAGLLVLVTVTAVHGAGRRGLVAVSLAAAAFGLLTFDRNPAFQSELSIWTDTVAKLPDSARAANNLGNALLRLDRTDEAIPHLERALALNPQYADAYNNRGVIHLRQEQPGPALAAFDQALKYKPNFADAHYNRGEAFLKLQRNEEAIAALDEALRQNPYYAKAYNNRAVALLNLGRVDDSLAAVRRALELDPALPEAHYNLGNALLRASDLPAALAAYDASLRIDPRYERSHNNAGVVLLRLGRKEEAAGRFRAALAIKPDYVEARNNLQLVEGG